MFWNFNIFVASTEEADIEDLSEILSENLNTNLGDKVIQVSKMNLVKTFGD